MSEQQKHVPRDVTRIGRVTAALEEAKIGALVCSLPTNVLLLTGYWPVIGTAVAIVSRDGFVCVLAPDDEKELARGGWADVVETVSLGSLDDLRTTIELLRGPLTKVLKDVVGRRGIVIGCETGLAVEPASYVGMHLFGPVLRQLLTEILPNDTIAPADQLLDQLRSVLSPDEQSRVRLACNIAANAFLDGTRWLRPSLTETEVAARFQTSLATNEAFRDSAARLGGFVFCMSGPNSAQAYAAYQRSRSRTIAQGDLVLIHCNSFVDGYWTDITRTFCLGPMDQQQRRMYEAIFAARAAAFNAIEPGVRAADVDRAARVVLSRNGFEKEFKHGLGHGVGFAAINHNALPRLHPASPDILEPGMIFNIEPAIYVDGFGGVRHCDMVLLNESGPEILTGFQSTVGSLSIE